LLLNLPPRQSGFSPTPAESRYYFVLGRSKTTSSGRLSSRRPRNVVWRNCSLSVHSALTADRAGFHLSQRVQKCGSTRPPGPTHRDTTGYGLKAIKDDWPTFRVVEVARYEVTKSRIALWRGLLARTPGEPNRRRICSEKFGTNWDKKDAINGYFSGMNGIGIEHRLLKAYRP
jgi:hypothetical protein